MILRSRFPLQSALRACRARPRLHSPIIRRNGFYTVPTLTHQEVYEKDGIHTVFSQQGYSIAWSQYQAYLLDNLNRMVEGTPNLINIVMRTARSADQADIFNFASLAFNNHFFFDGMNPNPPPMPPELEGYINESFSSVESLRATFIATADAMFGPGFVWLVKKPENQIAIVTTYIAGTPYPDAHFRRQPVDMNNVTTNIMPTMSTLEVHKKSQFVDAILRDRATSGGLTGYMSRQRWLPANTDMEPLLAVSTWEHTFMPDWGAWGKRAFLEKWWDKIDWQRVYTRVQWGGAMMSPTRRANTRLRTKVV